MAAIALRPLSALRPWMMTSAPWRASSRAVMKPMPSVAPVTRQILPCRFMVVLLGLVGTGVDCSGLAIVEVLLEVAEYLGGGVAAAVLPHLGDPAVADLEHEVVAVLVDPAIEQFAVGFRLGAHPVPLGGEAEPGHHQGLFHLLGHHPGNGGELVRAPAVFHPLGVAGHALEEKVLAEQVADGGAVAAVDAVDVVAHQLLVVVEIHAVALCCGYGGCRPVGAGRGMV